MVYRVVKRRIKRGNPHYKFLMEQAHLSKNLFNKVNFLMNKNYFHNQAVDKEGNLVFTKEGKPVKKLISPFSMGSLLRKKKDVDFYALPSNTAEEVVKVVCTAWVSYTKLLNKYFKDKGSLTGFPKPPRYLPKDGYFNLYFRRLKEVEGGYELPKSFGSMFIKGSREFEGYPLKQIRMIPKDNYIDLELVYDIGDVELAEEIEGGVSANIATEVSEDDVLTLTMVNNQTGEVERFDFASLSEKNQAIQAKSSGLTSLLRDCNNTVLDFDGERVPQYTSRRIARLWDYRKSSISTEFHQVSARMVKILSAWGVNNVYYQKPKSLKNGEETVDFVTLPYYLLGGKLEYKLGALGIFFREVDEL